VPVSTLATRRQRRQLRQAAGVPSPWGMFLKGFIKHPVMVGALVPSSGQLVKRMLSRVDWANTKVFVEYGPGVGTFSRAILDALPADATYIAIDTNEDFIRYLRHDIVDPRFSAVLGSAADVIRIVADHGHEKADYVLLDPARRCGRRDRPGDGRCTAPWRRLPGLSIFAEMP
jgi:predicted O-methyltransferase YrrM